LWDK